MPNHLHGIIQIVGAGLVPARMNTPDNQKIINRATTRVAPTLGDIIGAFKSFKSLATDEYIKGVRENKFDFFENRLFQRNYYERIIRNKEELNKISTYIKLNPLMWERDRNNPTNI